MGGSTGTGDSETFSYCPPVDGYYYLKCYVYSPSEGEMSDYELNLSHIAVVSPEASFTVAPGSGARPLSVQFDASGSNAPGGSITKYEWDFDGNGSYDLTKNAGAEDETLAAATYYTAGAYEAALRVTSDTGGQKTAKRTIVVTGAADDESEPNNDGDEAANGDADAALADTWPSFPFSDYYGRVGPKGTGGDPDDWYKFTLAGEGEVDILMELFDVLCDIDMRLYAEGDYSAYLAGSTGTDDDEQITLTLAAGTYYLRVYAYTSSPAWGGYRLEATFTP